MLDNVSYYHYNSNMIYNKYNKGEKKMKSKQGIKFKDLNIGDNFDWVNDDEPQWNIS